MQKARDDEKQGNDLLTPLLLHRANDDVRKFYLALLSLHGSAFLFVLTQFTKVQLACEKNNECAFCVKQNQLDEVWHLFKLLIKAFTFKKLTLKSFRNVYFEKLQPKL